MEFCGWIEEVLNGRYNNQRAEVVILCWAIWRARNELSWHKKASTVNIIVAGAKEYLTQCKEAQVRSFKAPFQPLAEGDGAISWAKPQHNTVKVAADATFEEHDAYGIGLVARDSEGWLIEPKSKRFQGKVRAELVEAMAI
ncbi:uncharacterized protein LOC141680893 [Apium graveolens]|uniref:uncharacterized protein LOC141680893 n=1 Tax=Apium graveolens TaxID=4045 RepID=UPI003D7B9233